MALINMFIKFLFSQLRCSVLIDRSITHASPKPTLGSKIVRISSSIQANVRPDPGMILQKKDYDARHALPFSYSQGGFYKKALFRAASDTMKL